MPQGRYTIADIDQPASAPRGRYTLADIDPAPPPLKPIPSHLAPEESLIPKPREEDPAVFQANLESMGALDGAGGEVATGLMKHLGNSFFRGGKFVRDYTPIGRLSDLIQPRAFETPLPELELHGNAQRAGAALGRLVEAAVPVGRVAKAVGKLPLVARMGANAATGGGVAAFQSEGDLVETFFGAAGGGILTPAAAAGRAARRAAAGAADGGLGGAIAETVRAVAPAEPRQIMTQALKPRSTRVNFESSLDLALPEIKAAEDAAGRAITNADEFLEGISAAKRNLQAQLQQMRGPRHAMGTEVDLSGVADAMARSIPKKVQLEAPDLATSVLAKADVYRKRFSLEDAETLLRETNAELDSFYAKYPMAQRRALTSDPAAAALHAQAAELRKAIYSALDAPGQGAAARELNRRYGALLEVENEAFRRTNVARRQQPESLSEQIGAVRAAGDMARGMWRLWHGELSGAADIMAGGAMRSTAKALKDAQTMDALIRRGMAGVKDRPAPVDIPLIPEPRALLERSPLVTPPPADRSGLTVTRGRYPDKELPASRLLPEPRTTPLPAPADPSGGRLLPADFVEVVDPVTGLVRRVYTGNVAR